MEKRKIEIMDDVVTGKPQECLFCCRKPTIAQLLLEELNIDRIEVASARVSEGEFQGVKGIMNWANEKDTMTNRSLLTAAFLIEWMKKAGAKVQIY
jgi:D-citramalate synthase